MSNVTINSLPTANTIDPIADLLPIYTNSVAATQSISRNTFLGITGNPIGTNDTQTLSNKTIGNTNTLTIKDSLFTLQDNGDTSKQAAFQLSGLTTATTRTYTLPDISDTLVTLTAAQTLTNKTLTSPIVNAPTIANATLSADAITGFTVSNSGVIYGISVATGVITTANSIGSGTIVQNGVGASQLSTTAITLGYAQTTSSFTTTSTTAVQITGLSVTVTVPAGGRRVKITAWAQSLQNSSSLVFNGLSIWDGTVGSGTQLSEAGGYNPGANDAFPIITISAPVPAAGSKTYNVGLRCGSGTAQMNAAATFPAFILVEMI